jgi:hypothetical protein
MENLLAEIEVHLAPGFEAEEGSDFHAGIATVDLLPCPPLRPSNSNDETHQFKSRNTEKACYAFPNPNHGEFTILFSDYSVISSVLITNSLGAVIFSDQKLNDFFKEINLSNQLPGVYFVKIESEKVFYNTKVIKN